MTHGDHRLHLALIQLNDKISRPAVQEFWVIFPASKTKFRHHLFEQLHAEIRVRMNLFASTRYKRIRLDIRGGCKRSSIPRYSSDSFRIRLTGKPTSYSFMHPFQVCIRTTCAARSTISSNLAALLSAVFEAVASAVASLAGVARIALGHPLAAEVVTVLLAITAADRLMDRSNEGVRTQRLGLRLAIYVEYLSCLHLTV